AAVGIKGTGLSYRQKISGNVIGTLFGGEKKEEAKAALTSGAPAALPASSPNVPASLSDKIKRPNPTGSLSVPAVSNAAAVLAEYEKNKEARVHIHRYAEPVLSREAFDERIENSASETGRELYALCLEKDEDTIENFVGTFMNNLELPYDVRVNYEYEDGTLFADLDLPEIEDLGTDYPVLVKEKITNKKKTQTDLRAEYAETVLSLGVFMTANFFNVSPTIETVVLSGFTTVRNQAGDPVDKYLYSVRFTRGIFEETEFAELEDLRSFYLKFENRINLSAANSFKAVKPFTEEAASKSNVSLEEAATALTGLGFSKSDVRAILPELEKASCETVQEYIKLGLKLLSGQRV
ncbi:MAG: hypothetical protein J5794_04795, partial [Lachnospiraceae bacterium]|nr:hypothetical protein [Lachnospiraceae bacterium]